MYLPTPKILAAAITLACASTTYAAPIDLDTSFSGDGKQRVNYSRALFPKKSFFTDVAVTPDDKIIAVGHASRNATQYEGLIVKHLADGSIDTTFATNGIFRHADQVDTRFNAVVIQADGKILIAGNQRDNGVSYKLIVLRLNNDGTLDTGFADNGVYTVRYSNPATSPNSRPAYGHLHGRDIAINSQGEIFISASQYMGRTVNLHRYLGHIIKLDSHGVLDTGFGYKGATANNGDTRLVYRDYNNYSVDITKLAFDANDRMFVGGQWSHAGSGTPSTMFVQRIETDGKTIHQPNPFSNAIYNRWSATGDPGFNNSNTAKQILNAVVVLPGGDIISAGCNTALTATPTRMQRQTPAGSFATGFGTNGVVTARYNNQEDCFRDLNYHPTVGIIAVGITGAAPLISYTDKDTGISAVSNTLSVTGYFDGVATLSTGQIIAVGNAENTTTGDRESLISVFEGSALSAASLPAVSMPSFSEQTNVAVNTGMQSTTESLTITPTGSLTAELINGSAEINSVSQNSSTITITDADNIMLSHTSNSEPETETITHLVIDRGAGFNHNNKSWKPTDIIRTFKTTTLAADTSPNAFSLSYTGLAPEINAVTTSNTATIAGINATVDVSISAGGEYSIHRASEPNAEAYTSADGTIRVNDQITVRHTNSSSFATETLTTLVVGDRSVFYRSTTTNLDAVPDAFSLGGNFLDVQPNSVQISNHFYVAGINTTAPISVTNGKYSINNGTYTSATGTVSENDFVRTQIASGSTFGQTTMLTLNIGGVTSSFSSTVAAVDNTPDAFSFPIQTNVAIGSTVTSEQITVAGINYNTQVTISNGEMSINGGSYSTSSAYVDDGDTITVRHTSSANLTSNTDSILTIGGVSGTFTSVTTSSIAVVPSDTSPDAFSFPSQTDSSLSEVITAGAISITGINTATTITVTNGEYRLNGTSTWTSAAGTLNNGDTVNVRHTSSAQNSTSTTTEVNIGGVTSRFESTTLAASTPTGPVISNPTPTDPTPTDPTPTDPTPTDPIASSGGGSGGGGSMNFLYLLGAGWLFNRKRKS